MQYQSATPHFQELIAQVRNVLGHRSEAESPNIIEHVVIARSNSNHTGVFIATASGLELVFAFDASGAVKFYAASFFWQSELKAWALKAWAKAVETETVETETRPHFLDTPKARRSEYLLAQGRMFGACRNAGLDITDRDGMISGINRLLGINITSRTQLTPWEMRIVKAAIEEGCFAAGWQVVREVELGKVALVA
jgi:hypothetical protein